MQSSSSSSSSSLSPMGSNSSPTTTTLPLRSPSRGFLEKLELSLSPLQKPSSSSSSSLSKNRKTVSTAIRRRRRRRRLCHYFPPLDDLGQSWPSFQDLEEQQSCQEVNQVPNRRQYHFPTLNDLERLPSSRDLDVDDILLLPESSSSSSSSSSSNDDIDDDGPTTTTTTTTRNEMVDTSNENAYKDNKNNKNNNNKTKNQEEIRRKKQKEKMRRKILSNNSYSNNSNNIKSNNNNNTSTKKNHEPPKPEQQPEQPEQQQPLLLSYRSAEETEQAWQRGECNLHAKCYLCYIRLAVMADCHAVICPVCFAVSPVDDDDNANHNTIVAVSSLSDDAVTHSIDSKTQSQSPSKQDIRHPYDNTKMSKNNSANSGIGLGLQLG